jgi:hypothetical protein
LEPDIVLKFAAAVDLPADLIDVLTWPPDVVAVHQHGGIGVPGVALGGRRERR